MLISWNTVSLITGTHYRREVLQSLSMQITQYIQKKNESSCNFLLCTWRVLILCIGLQLHALFIKVLCCLGYVFNGDNYQNRKETHYTAIGIHLLVSNGTDCKRGICKSWNETTRGTTEQRFSVKETLTLLLQFLFLQRSRWDFFMVEHEDQ